MHCKRCDYPLWDLATRVCPECGLGFSPVDYEFVVNSVRFMCPHCRQAYYGTGEKGHLQPRRFACVKCAREIDEAEMVLLPTAGVSEVQTVGGVAAWRERAKRGRVGAFFKSIGQASFVPHQLGRYCGQTVNAWEAWWFGLLTLTLTVLCGAGLCGGFIAFMEGSRLGMQGGAGDLFMQIGKALMWVLVPMAATALFAVLWALSAHALLLIGNPKRPHFGKTMECFGYAWGACFLMAVPCFGMYMVPLAVIWVAVSAIIQLSVRQEAAVGRVVTAVLTLPVLLLVAAVGGFIWLVSSFP